VKNHKIMEPEKKNQKSSAVFGPMRLPFLILNPVSVAIGTATASWAGYELNPLYIALILLGAVAAHIAVNALNEYDDFKSGLDLKTERTPFSGGSGALPESPEKAHFALITGIAALAATLMIGLYFLYIRGPQLLVIVVPGVAIILAYTKWLTRNPLLCLIAPGLGFGPFMIMGTNFALTGHYSPASFVASLVSFFLVNDLLLLNQFPDVEADKTVGRRHLAIAVGIEASAKIYILLLGCAFLTVALGCLAQILPFASLMALASALLAAPLIYGVLKYADNIPKLAPYMGMNVALNIVMPVLLAIGLFIAA